MPSVVCVLAEMEPGGLSGLARVLDRLGLGYEQRSPAALQMRDDPGVPVVLDPRCLLTGQVPIGLATSRTAPPLLAACAEADRMLVSAALARGLCDVVDPDGDPAAIRQRLEIAGRFGLRRRMLRLYRETSERFAPLERVRPDPAAVLAAEAAKPRLLVAGPGGAAQVDVLQVLGGWARATIAPRFDAHQDTTDLDLVVLTGPSATAPGTPGSPPLAGALQRPAPVIALGAFAADVADRIPTRAAPELIKLRLRAWLGHRVIERELRGSVDEWARPALIDPASCLYTRSFFLDLVDAVLRFPGGAATAMLGLSVDGVDELARRHGQVIGDRALRLIGRAIAALTRAEDLAARIDQARFAIALPAAELAGADAMARRLAVQLATIRLPGLDTTRLRAATAVFRVGQDARRLVDAALDRVDLESARIA
jgi:GGDEF domain-containing protein